MACVVECERKHTHECEKLMIMDDVVTVCWYTHATVDTQQSITKKHSQYKSTQVLLFEQVGHFRPHLLLVHCHTQGALLPTLLSLQCLKRGGWKWLHIE